MHRSFDLLLLERVEDIYFARFDNRVYLHVTNHHPVDQNTEQYLGMVCHYNQCPKHKPECRVTGCGAEPFVRVLPRFNLKPHRLNSHNSQILFAR